MEFTILVPDGKYKVKLITHYHDKEDIKPNKLDVNGVMFYGTKSKKLDLIDEKVVEAKNGKIVISDGWKPTTKEIVYPRLSFIMIKKDDGSDTKRLARKMANKNLDGEIK